MTAETTIAKLKAHIAEAQAYAKFIAACVGGLLVIGSTFIPAEWAGWITAGVAALTAFSVWRFPNVSPVDNPTPGQVSVSTETYMTDDDGRIVVKHGLGRVPRSVTIQSQPWLARASEVGAESFVITVFDKSGEVIRSQEVSLQIALEE